MRQWSAVDDGDSNGSSSGNGDSDGSNNGSNNIGGGRDKDTAVTVMARDADNNQLKGAAEKTTDASTVSSGQ